MGNGAQHLLRPGHLDVVAGRARGTQGDGCPVETMDGAAVDLLEQIRKIGRDDVDERRLGGCRLLLGVGPALRHRLLDQGHVPLALRGEGAGVSGDVGRHFLRHRLVDFFPITRDRMSGADVRAGRHRGDVGSHGDEKPGGRGAAARGRDENGNGRLRLDDGRVDIARRIDEPARRAQEENHEAGARGVGLCDRLTNVGGRDRMNDAVDLSDVDDGRRRREARWLLEHGTGFEPDVRDMGRGQDHAECDAGDAGAHGASS